MTKLADIAAEMIAQADYLPYVTGAPIQPYQRTLPRGLTLTLRLVGECYILSMTRRGVEPSPREVAICRQVFGIPDHIRASHIENGEYFILSFTWYKGRQLELDV